MPGQRPGRRSRSEQRVHVLTNSNFGRNTQASTGSTTGNFFVGSTRLGADLQGPRANLGESCVEKDPPVKNTIFAKVDCTGNGDKVCSRFKVRSFPTLHLFAKGNMYEYDGKRDFDSLRAFAEGNARRRRKQGAALSYLSVEVRRLHEGRHRSHCGQA